MRNGIVRSGVLLDPEDKRRLPVIRRAPPWAARRLCCVAALLAATAAAGAADRTELRLEEPDTIATTGRSLEILATLDDPSRRVVTVRFSIDGERMTGQLRNLAEETGTFFQVVTPRDVRRVSVLVEALSADGSVIARAVRWITPVSPIRETVRVEARADWSEFVPGDSNLRQNPVVFVHPLFPERLGEDERTFGLNRRPVNVVFLVDVKGFEGELPTILEALAGTARPDLGAMRSSDEVGILLVSDRVRVHRDFTAPVLGPALKRLQGGQRPAGGPAALPDLGETLSAVMAAAPRTRTTVCVVVTNGVFWGSYWRRKTIPGLGASEALLTPDDMKGLRALSFVREIPVFTLAVSTNRFPLEADEDDRLDFSSLTAVLLGDEPASRRRFESYIREMFDLLRSISEATGAGRRIWLARATPSDLGASVSNILSPIVGKFQRRDFRVVEAPSRESCLETGRAQLLDGAEFRGGDKMIIGIALDESGSTQTELAAEQITTAAGRLAEAIRPEEDCILLYTFSAGVPATSLECFGDPDRLKELIEGRVRFGGWTDIYGAALSVAQDLTDFEDATLDAGMFGPGQEMRKVIVLITDGYQTVDNLTAHQVGRYLRRHDVMLFQVFIQGGIPGGAPTRGWAPTVGGLDLPVAGEERPAGERPDIAPLIESVYWGARESYRLAYTSDGTEKSRREVCVGIADRDDLFVSKEHGDAYVSDRSAVSFVVEAAKSPDNDLPRRKRAIEVLSEIGTRFELRDLLRLASGKEAALHVPALLAYLSVARREDAPPEKTVKALGGLDPATRLDLVTALPARGSGARVVERLLVGELTRADNREHPRLRIESVLALGRLPVTLSPETLTLLESLRADGDPGVRAAVAALLDGAGLS